MRSFVGLSLAALLFIGATSLQGEEKKEFKANCPVSNKAAKKEHAVDYKGAKVYFCCPNCPGAFKGDTAKFATRANHQLAVTGQFVEKKCPLSGGDLDADTAIDVAGAKVAFCCNMCKGKVADASGDAQLELVFAEKPFAKAYELKKK